MRRTAAIRTTVWLLSGAALLAVTALLPATAQAQDWKQYRYDNAGFVIQLPVPPTVQSGTYARAGGASLPMTSYVARQEGIVYRLDVVDFSGTHADETRTIAEAEKAMGATGKVTVAIDARVSRSFGRELSINGADGSRSAVAIFYVDDHLFVLDGHSLPPDAIARSGNAIRFEESLQFIGQNGGFGGFRGGGRFGGGRGRFGGGGPQALSACQGKSVGDSVQLQTPQGPVAATCTLIARPNGPPPDAPPGPNGPQNP
jgi:uncharacterized membrane protein YgcG